MFGEMSYNCGLNLLYEEYFSKPNVPVVRKKIFEEGIQPKSCMQANPGTREE